RSHQRRPVLPCKPVTAAMRESGLPLWVNFPTFYTGVTSRPRCPCDDIRAGTHGGPAPQRDGMATTGTIVVIDDDEHIRELASLYLGKEGFQVVTAADGNDAVERTRQA